MSAFYEHHKDSIKFRYGCFDRILLSACIQSFLDGARAQGFFWVYRKIYPVSRKVLRDVANDYHSWVASSAQKWGVEVVDPPDGRRDDFVEPYFQRAKPDQVVVIIKAREPAGIMTATGAGNKWHLETKYRWVNQYNFYLQDAEWGPMFIRVCPYFPFSTRICLNQHHWLAHQMKQAGIRFQQSGNAFRRCSDAEALQKIADSLTSDDLIRCGHKWLKRLIPFFHAKERREAGCWHQLFFSQVEYCDNLIFWQRAALDEMGERLLDANRNKMRGITNRYQDVQQDILETFLDRGELTKLAEPTVLANGKRIPGLKLDHPRQLALMSSLVRFSHVAAGDTFTTAELRAGVAEALGIAENACTLGSLRYELWKLRAKDLIEKLPRSRRYRLVPNGYRICLVFLKLFDKVYAPLTAGLLHPYRGDRAIAKDRLQQLDRLYQSVTAALDQLVAAVGLKVAA